MGALNGVRVLDLTQVLAGPYCTMLLADHGADVVKVEPPRGGDSNRGVSPMTGGVSYAFYAINRNKRSMVLNLKEPAGREVFLRMARRADVVVENYRPGVADRLGIGYSAVSAVNAGIVYCSLSGFGQQGPYRDRGGYDPMVQAMSGMMSANGLPGRPPVKVSTPLSDIGAGMYGAMGIAMALLARATTGRGQDIDISLFDTALAFSVWELVSFFGTGEVPAPLGSRHRIIAPAQAYRTADGYLMLTAANEKLWGSLCQALEVPGLAADPRFSDNARRMKNVDDLEQILEERLTTGTTAAWAERLDAAGVPCAPVNRYDQVVKDPHVAAREMLVDIDHPAGGAPLRVPGIPLKLGGTPGTVRRSAPALGQHTAEVLEEYGFSAEERASLTGKGIV